MDYNLLITLAGLAFTGASVVLHTQYQANATKEELKEYKKDVDKDLSDISNRLSTYFKKLDSHGEDIRSLQTEKESFLTAKDADDIYLRIKEFDRFEKHIDKRFDSIESSMGKILVKLDSLKG